MMSMAGWKGTEAALLGLDVLRADSRSGQPAPSASGGPATGQLVLDFEGERLIVVS